jgi:uncharacterized C2H2 Zn-finger protein
MEQKKKKQRTSNTAEFIGNAKLVHKDKYGYNLFEFIDSRTKGIITCDVHGPFEQTPDNHLRGRGCPDCANVCRSKKQVLTKETFIEKAKIVHKHKYGYSQFEYIGYQTKGIITCEVHGPFEQTPNNHLSGKGCPDCGIITRSQKKRSNKDSFIEQARLVHGYTYGYLQFEYRGARIKGIIYCEDHGPFEKTPNNHLQGQGCPDCAFIIRSKKKTSNVETFIAKAKIVHKDRYGYSKVNYHNNYTNVIISCHVPGHGDFEQIPSSHLAGSGCPKCAGVYRRTTAEFIDDAKKVHGDKYGYSKLMYKTAHDKVIITCDVPTHGDFEQSPDAHLRGAGCPKCYGNLPLSTEEFIERAMQVHKGRYGYFKVLYINSQTKVTITCELHGDFDQAPVGHLQGHGCPKCGGHLPLSTEEFIERANKVHSYKYGYTKVMYKTAHAKVIITCDVSSHGDFEQSPANHLSGSGCPKCFYSYSKKQIKWLTLMQIKDSCHIQNAKNEGEYKIPTTNFRADGYCVETNTVYEFHGDYWHGNPKKFNAADINPATKTTYSELYCKTLKKEEIIKSLGYNLVTIWESEWDTFTRLKKEFQNKFKKKRSFSA